MFDSTKKVVDADMLEAYHQTIASLVGSGGSQISTMPTASSECEDVIYQYIGDTTSSYTNGYFYKCVEDPNNVGTYIWENVSVQSGSGGTASFPVGGTTGQALVKASNADNDVEWGDVAPNITVDSVLSDSSENPVQNKIVKTAIDSKISTSSVGIANGVAELDSNGKVPSSQLPSYVDDTIEGYLYNSKWYSDSSHTTEVTGETGKIYVDLSTNKTYRWSGSAFVEISESLALGETSSTAYAGNKGKANADAIGTLSSLVTTAKTNLVLAINEIKNSLKTVATTGAFDDLTGRPDASSNIDMSEVCTPLPSNMTDGIIYSTTERKVGQWIDGKPIYQKTVSCGALPNATTKTVAHNISNVNYIIDYHGISMNPTSHISIILPYPGENQDITVYVDRTNINIVDKTDNSRYTTTYVTLQYTKTTD